LPAPHDFGLHQRDVRGRTPERRQAETEEHRSELQHRRHDAPHTSAAGQTPRRRAKRCVGRAKIPYFAALRRAGLLQSFAASSGITSLAIPLKPTAAARRAVNRFKNVPVIIAGNGGGYLKQGAFVDAANSTNNRLFNTLINAAVRDKAAWTQNFGAGSGSGPISALVA